MMNNAMDKKEYGNETVVTEIDKAMDACMYVNTEGSLQPYVCIVCDKFLMVSEIRYIGKEDLIEAREHLIPKRTLHKDVVEYYKYTGEGSDVGLEDHLLSPKGCYVQRLKRDCFVVCESCRNCLKKKHRTPQYAISNYFEIGIPPKEILELTSIEVAFLSSIRCHMHVLTFCGGHKGIKGWHCMLKTNMSDKGRILEGMDSMKRIPNTVAVVMYGPMTDEQRERIRGMARIRRDLCLKAFNWLLNNHDYYRRHVALEEFKDMGKVVVVDKSTEVQSNKTNLESTLEVRVVFPDETLNCQTGGLCTVEKLNDSIKKRFCGGHVEAHVRLTKSEFVRDFEGSNLTLAFLKQYPYGYGGIEVKRMIADNGSFRKLYNDEYFRHVTNLSNLSFHEGIFTLVAFNMYFRTKMMQSACWKIRVNSKLAEGICNATVADTVRNVQKRCQNGLNRLCQSGRSGETVHADGTGGSSFVKMVSAMSSSLPHTSEAAWKGRSNLLAMQVCLGIGHVFFTASPTEDNSAIILVHAGLNKILLEEDLTYRNVLQKSKERSEVAFSYPGLSTLNFEVALRIIIRCVIGWKNKDAGWFGKPAAYFFSVEEQGRKMLHCHFIVWLSAPHPIDVSALGTGRKGTRAHKAIEKKLVTYVDKVSSCSIFGDRLPCLKHQCPCRNIRKVAVKDCQSLRNLRHIEGCRKEKMTVFSCPQCKKEWCSSEAALSYAIQSNPRIQANYGIEADRSEELHGIRYETYLRKISEQLVFESRYPGAGETYPLLVNALYNIHSSGHVKSCFSDKSPECRYRFPKKANEKTRIDYLSIDEVFDFNGGQHAGNEVSIVGKRGPADVFSNTFCPALSKSKLACNTNIATILNHKIAFYVAKYVSKDTSAQDSKDYSKMCEFLSRRCLSRRFDNNRSESLSRVIGSCLAHNSQNVISAPMAKYLINNGSRFGKSHEIQYVPMSHLKSWLRENSTVFEICPGNQTDSTARKESCRNEVSFYVESSALHYILRPTELENISAYCFFSEYTVCQKKSRRKDDEILHFMKEHPGNLHRCVKKRVLPVLPGISNFQFIDTKHLSGNLLDLKCPSGTLDEEYAFTVLVLFCPFRSNSDLQIGSSYVRKYQQVYKEVVEPNGTILQNIQNIRNGCRKNCCQDDLEKETVMFMNEGSPRDMDTDDGEEPENNVCFDYENSFVDSLLCQQSEETTCEAVVDCMAIEKGVNFEAAIEKMSFDDIRSRGCNKCGFNRLCPSVRIDDLSSHFVEFDNADDSTSSVAQKRKRTFDEEEGEPTLQHIAGVLSLCVTSRNIKHPSLQKDMLTGSVDNAKSEVTKELDSIEICANGSAQSIIKWSQRKEWNGSSYDTLDDDQKHAFILICVHFVMSYIEKAERTELCSSMQHVRFIGGVRDVLHAKSTIRVKSIELRKLLVVKGAVRLFLDGPGGSGKSRIIQEVMAYCRAFCMLLNVSFSKYTINVTASTGVAATMIAGQTVHAALGLQRKILGTDEIARFADVRLLIIDEVSMISKSTLLHIEQHLRKLRNPLEYYGGVNVVFIGDFRQLKAIGTSKQDQGTNPSIYADPDFCEWYDAINVYIQLKGRYRFIHDRKWGAILERLRDGCLVPSDFDIINDRVVDPYTLMTRDGDKMPEGIRYCTAGNLERDAINTALFEERVASTGGLDSLLVFSDCLGIKIDDKGKGYKDLANPSQYYKQCAENDCKFLGKRSTRIDPVLKLYPGCPIMLTDNFDVEKGLANGTEAVISKVVLKRGRCIRSSCLGSTEVQVKSVLASDIARVELKSRTAMEGTFNLTPKKFNFTASFLHPSACTNRKNSKFTRKMTACQLPFIHNSATTAHKLQGSTCETLYINGFSYRSNWPYVALSRVKTLHGLFLREPLRPDADFSVDAALSNMNRYFRTSKTLPSSFLQSLSDMTNRANNG